MKNRLLPSGFLALLAGCFSLLVATVSFAGQPGQPVTGNPSGGISPTTTDYLAPIRANQVTGTVDPSDVLKAREQVASHQLKSAGATTLDWVEAGPNNAAGKTRAVIFDNRDASGNTLIAGAVTGGLWKSTSLGLVWHEINTLSNEVLRVSSMVQLPSGTIYVGTGDWYCGGYHEIGTGLYRSDDGENFSVVPTAQPSANNPESDWAFISKLACNSNGRIFAATNTGLKYSDDGSNWQTLLSGTAIDVVVGNDGTVLAVVDNKVYVATGGDLSALTNLSTGETNMLPSTGVGWIQVAIAPSDPNVLYASIAKNTNVLMNIYRSSDKGASWSVIFPANSLYDPFNGAGCYGNTISVFPNDPDQVLLGGLDMWRGVKMDEGYFNWEEVSYGSAYFASTFFLPFFHHAYVFNPADPSVVIVASDNGLSKGTISSDNILFQTINKHYQVGQFVSVDPSMSKDGIMGGGVANGTMVVFGGNVLNEPTTGQLVSQEYYPSGYNGNGGPCEWSMINPSVVIYSISGLTAPWRRSEDFGVTVSPTFLGTLNNNNNIPYPPIQLVEDFNDLNSFDSISLTAGERTIPADSLLVLYSDNQKFPFRYVTPVEIPQGTTVKVTDPIQTRFYLAGTKGSDDGIFMTKDALKFAKDPEWYCVATTPDPPSGTNAVVSMTVSPDHDYLWAGTNNGTLYRLGNLRAAHDSATANYDTSTCVVNKTVFDTIQYSWLKGRYVTSVSISNDNNRVVVTLGNYGNSTYVYYSNNALDPVPTFQAAQGDLPAMPVYCSMIEKSNQSKVIIGTDFGAYSTENIAAGSPVWTAESKGLGNVAITAIRQQTNEGIYYHRPDNFGTIVLASYGNGMFKDTTYRTILGIDPGQTQSGTAANTVRIEPNPFREQVNISFTLSKPADVKVTVYDLTGRTVTSYYWNNLNAGKQTRSLSLAGVPAGTYLISVDDGTTRAFGKAVKTN